MTGLLFQRQSSFSWPCGTKLIGDTGDLLNLTVHRRLGILPSITCFYQFYSFDLFDCVFSFTQFTRLSHLSCFTSFFCLLFHILLSISPIHLVEFPIPSYTNFRFAHFTCFIRSTCSTCLTQWTSYSILPVLPILTICLMLNIPAWPSELYPIFLSHSPCS